MDNCSKVQTDLNFINSTEFAWKCPLDGLPWWAGVVENFYLSVIMIVGIPGNVFILFSHKVNRDKTSTDYLIAVMAVFEIFCSSVNAFGKIIQNTAVWTLFATDTVCRVNQVFLYMTSFASSYLLAGIALDRYFKTCHPLKNIYTIKQSKIICFLASLASVLTGCTTLVTFELDDKLVCTIAEQYIDFQLKWDMAVISSTGIVFVIFIFSYVSIAIELHRRIRLRKRQITQLGDKSSTFSKKFKVPSAIKKYSKSKVEPDRNLTEIDKNTNFVIETRHLGTGKTSVQFSYATTSQSQNQSSVQDQRSDNADQDTKTNTAGSSKVSVSRNQTYMEQTVNRTTLIMFLLTLIYAITYAIVNTCVMTTNQLLGDVMQKLCKSLLMLNCISNPVLFFCMSSKYRSTAKELILKLRRR